MDMIVGRGGRATTKCARRPSRDGPATKPPGRRRTRTPPTPTARASPQRGGQLSRAYSVKRAVRAAPHRRRGTRQRSFSRAELIACLREWEAIYGTVPTVADWEPSRARRAGREWQAKRFEAGGWPSMSVVRREFQNTDRRHRSGWPRLSSCAHSKTQAKWIERDPAGDPGMDPALRRTADDG